MGWTRRNSGSESPTNGCRGYFAGPNAERVALIYALRTDGNGGHAAHGAVVLSKQQ